MADETTAGTRWDGLGRIDFGMLSTRREGGAVASRPTSNNGAVEYRGESVFSTVEKARTVSDIERVPEVGPTFTGAAGLVGEPPMRIAVEGDADLIRDNGQFAAPWTKHRDRRFEKGLDTPGMAMVRVHATRIHDWNGSNEGEVAL